MNPHEEAQKLAVRPYLVMTTVDETTDGQPVYFARVLEIEGCFGQGESKEQALQDLRAALVDYIESLLEDFLPVPEPAGLVKSSGTSNYIVLSFSGHGKVAQPKEGYDCRDAYILTPA